MSSENFKTGQAPPSAYAAIKLSGSRCLASACSETRKDCDVPTDSAPHRKGTGWSQYSVVGSGMSYRTAPPFIRVS